MKETSYEALLICNSNMFMLTVLTEVLSHREKQYLVISDIDSIILFLNFLEIPNMTVYQYGRKGCFDVIKQKRILYDFVKQYDINRVVFFHTEFGEMANWLIMKLAKRVPVYFCKVYDRKPAPKSKDYYKVAKIKIFQYLYWNMHVDVLNDFRSFPSLPDAFYKKYCKQVITMPVDTAIVSSYVSFKLSYYNIKGKFLLLTGTVVDNGMYSEEIYEPFINHIIELLGEENVVSKCHPRFNRLFGKEKDLLQIPSFIPGSVLLDNFDCVIGFESTLLVEAAEADKVSLSLIDWLRPEEYKREQIHKLIDSRLKTKSVLFPKNEEEMSIILGA